ncbi:MAG: tRNA preQ1(34) S-adenosylmethionine ribosyltransferase-isomerase QueA [Richelia sp.]|nr:tRNA preQ1(34) S-adenosylmethionine ribosyltransferase-isomerase QueA [Richelia sp.]CDN11871.1 S-adenosylmethionine:tRNA ribosyltransferase-isomerase [Richelia intracellularis]
MTEHLTSKNTVPNSETTETNLDLCLSGYEYELPPEMIAQNPASPRDSSKLLVVNSVNTGNYTEPVHDVFRNLPGILQPGDLLVMNNTKVIPARLYGHKSTGAEIEVLLLEERQQNCWLGLVKPGKRFKLGTQLIFTTATQGDGSEFHLAGELTATVIDNDEATGGRLLQFDVPEGMNLMQLLDVFGEVPLPPYITNTQADDEQYQTVYAETPGAIAAPTAGLHFTPELLEKLRTRGINQAFVTLHVGLSTFRPVEVKNITRHNMHEEWIEVPAATVEQIRQTGRDGGRIIAVGTTVVRSLESAAALGEIAPFCGKSNLFIYPGYKWKVVEGLITNFHLPRSSLLMLVSALIGRERLLSIYQQAIASGYRFYSFGDAMLILPEAVN